MGAADYSQEGLSRKHALMRQGHGGGPPVPNNTSLNSEKGGYDDKGTWKEGKPWEDYKRMKAMQDAGISFDFTDTSKSLDRIILNNLLNGDIRGSDDGDSGFQFILNKWNNFTSERSKLLFTSNRLLTSKYDNFELVQEYGKHLVGTSTINNLTNQKIIVAGDSNIFHGDFIGVLEGKSKSHRQFDTDYVYLKGIWYKASQPPTKQK